MKTEIKNLPNSQIELEFELTAEEFAEHFEHAIEHLKSHVKVDGFRPGQAPAKMVEEKIKPEALLMEAGDHAVQHVYSDYVRENNLEPISQPEVKIIKIAKGSPFVFTATITVLPEVNLPDYKKIASAVKGQEFSVTEEEVQDSLNYLQKSRAKMSLKNEPAEKKDFVQIEYQSKDIEDNKTAKDAFILGEGRMIKGFEENLEGMKAGEEKDFKLEFPKDYHNKNLAGKDVAFHAKMISVQKMELPEINDEFAEQLGAFDTLVALKGSIKEGITAEKTEQEKQRKRGEILEKIAEKTKVEIPDVMVEYEKKNLLEDLKNRIQQTFKDATFSGQGGPASGWEDYLSAIKKTEEEIKETFQKEAEKRLRGFLVLRELGKKENIEVSDDEVKEEINKNLKRTLRGASNEKFKNLKQVDIEQLKEYTKGVIYNEKIFQKLENLSS